MPPVMLLKDVYCICLAFFLHRSLFRSVPMVFLVVEIKFCRNNFLTFVGLQASGRLVQRYVIDFTHVRPRFDPRRDTCPFSFSFSRTHFSSDFWVTAFKIRFS